MADMTAPRTNVEAWQLVHDGIAAGLTIGQIAARHDLSYRMAHKWSRMPEPPARRPLGTRPVDCATARVPLRLCVECGAAVRGRPTTRCLPCQTDRYDADSRQHIDALHAHAERAGHVPTVAESADILGMSRSRAGELMRLAFGADPRPEGPPRHTRRPWPPHDPPTDRVD